MDYSRLRRSRNIEDRRGNTLERILMAGARNAPIVEGGHEGTLSSIPDLPYYSAGQLSVDAGLGDLRPMTPEEYARWAARRR